MTWEPDEVFRRGLAFFGAAVAGLDPGGWYRPSPCAGWRAIDVLGHVGQATRFGAALMAGSPPQWSPVAPPGSAVAGDPATWWGEVAGPAREALDGLDLSLVVDSPLGRRSIGDGLSFPGLDLFVHAWDLGASAGRDVELPAEAIEFGRRVLGAIPEAQLRRPQTFGRERAAAAGASATAAFIAWTGRNPGWKPPA